MSELPPQLREALDVMGRRGQFGDLVALAVRAPCSEPKQEEAQPCDGCGHPEHVAHECPVTRYGERCACDEPVAAPEGSPDDPRLALLRALNSPPYDLAAGLRGMPLGEAVQLLDDYRAVELLEAAEALERRFGVTPATVELRLMSAKAQR